MSAAGSRIAEEIARFDPGPPVERSATPPASWYVDPAIHELELATVFRRSWQAVARTDQIAAPGDYVAGCFAGEPWVLLRDGAGEARGFFNVCRHHAAAVVEGEGRVEQLVCPYHRWTYDLDGRLRKAPRLGAVDGFTREDNGLVPFEVGFWGPLAFSRFAPGGPSLETLLAPLAGRIEVDGLRFVARREYEIDCNWKVFVDNYLDGGYHVEHLHRGLGSQLDLDGYRNEIHPWLSLQTCGAAAERGDGEASGEARGIDFRERVGTGAVYAFVYPNLMLNRYGPILDTNWVVPLGTDRTRTVFDYYFDAGHADDAEFVSQSLAASDRVQQEDLGICASVQRGLGSRAYDRGRYARVEEPMHHFHRLLAADLRSAP